ncbi:MAG: hypothetical protein Q7U91_05840 [Sideroxyarcus sp.]|nr:hypothetical protein [Sideroxyarcus sp.]
MRSKTEGITIAYQIASIDILGNLIIENRNKATVAVSKASNDVVIKKLSKKMRIRISFVTLKFIRIPLYLTPFAGANLGVFKARI